MNMSRKELKNDELTLKVGLTIRYLRQARQWSQEELGGILGISIPAVSKFESGITDLSISRLLQIAHVFAVPISYFFEDEENTDQTEADLKKAQAELQKKDQQIIALQNRVIKLLTNTNITTV